MKIYRAMCTEEFFRTQKYRKPDFTLKRFKWFSPRIDFIKTRVKDGKFNNSRFVKDRYKHVCEFEIDGLDFLKDKKEIQIDVRKNYQIIFVGEIYVD